VSSNVTETQNPNNSLPETLNRFLYAYLHALLGADEGIWVSWQCVMAICDEGDGLALCGSLS
jgi:hypothetical protein